MSRAVGTLGLPRAARLRQANEIQAVFQKGRREERRAFVLLWVPSRGAGRMGFAVSRQIRSAVLRNRAKRRLREAYRTLGSARPRGVDAMLVARAWALEAPLAELRVDIARALGAASGNAGG